MNFLRIKQAQCALADGRLDEAHSLLSLDAVRSHRQGQRLATKLVQAYVERGCGHLEAGRLNESLADCEKAGTLGGNDPAVTELRQRVLKQMQDKRHDAERHNMALGAARRHADEGFLSRGAELLREINGDSARVMQAEQELDLHRAKADAAVERCGAALDREDWTAAGHHLVEARRLRPYDGRVEELTSRLSRHSSSNRKRAVKT